MGGFRKSGLEDNSDYSRQDLKPLYHWQQSLKNHPRLLSLESCCCCLPCTYPEWKPQRLNDCII